MTTAVPEACRFADLRTPGKRRAPRLHAQRLAAVAGWVPSPNYSSRGGTPVTGVCIHTAEGITEANALGAFFADRARQASSHVGLDDTKRVNYVDPKFEAWTLRNGNPWTDNAEMCGFASWTRAQWLAHPGMLRNTADWVAERCHARNVPPRRITADDIRAGRRSGYFAHWDYTRGTGDGTHWDVGSNLPWDVFDGLVQDAYNGTTPEDVMNAQQEAEMKAIGAAVSDIQVKIGNPRTGMYDQLQALKGQVAALTAAMDPTKFAVAITAVLPASSGLTGAQVEQAVRKVLGSLDNA